MSDRVNRYRLVVIHPACVEGHYAPGARREATPAATEEYLAHCADGATVLDLREVVERDIGLVLRAPYVDPFLPDGQIGNRHGLGRALADVARAVWGADADGMVANADGFPFNAFDTVALDLYTAYWRHHGARVGRIQNGAVVWEDCAPAATEIAARAASAGTPPAPARAAA